MVAFLFFRNSPISVIVQTLKIYLSNELLSSLIYFINKIKTRHG